MHAAGGPDAFLEDHAVIVLADHSHSLVEGRIPLRDAFADAGVLDARGSRAPEEARDRALPGPALGDGLRARRRAPGGAGARDRGHGGRDRGRRPRRCAARATDAVVAAPCAASCASRPAERRRRPPRRALERRGRPRGAGRARRRTAIRSARLPGRARARLVGAELPERGRRAALGGARATSSSTGAASTTSAAAATARCTATTRSAPCCGAVAASGRARDRATSAGNGRSATSTRRWSPSTSAWRDRAQPARPPTPARHARRGLHPPPAGCPPRAPRHAPARQLVPARALRRRRRERATSSTSPSSRLRPRPGRWTTGSPPTIAFLVAVTNNFLLEPPLDVRRARRPRRLPGGALLRRQHRRVRLQPGRAAAAGVGAGLAEGARRRRSRSSPATPLNFLGNKLWSFRA